MGKKWLSALTAVCMTAVFVFAANAHSLPFETIPAPEDMHFVFSYPNEGSECIEAVFSQPDEISRIATLSIAEQEKYYGSNFDVCVQFDWAIDDKASSHYDASWDTAAGDYPIQKLDGSFVQRAEVFWFAYEDAAARCAEGIVEKGGAKTFDFDHHALYIRARFFLYDYGAEECVFSDWTDFYDAGTFRDAKPEKVPDVGDARLTVAKGALDADDAGKVTFELRIPDEIKRAALVLKRDYGLDLNLESQVRFDGGEWQYWILPNELYPYLVGMRQFSVDPEVLQGKVEYRCRYTGGNPDNDTAVTTGWSDILTVEDGKVRMAVNDDPFDLKAAEAERLAAEKEANKCKVCGICPHPLGLCLFIWLGIAAAVAAIIAYNVIAHKKNVKKQAEIKAREEASRSGSSVDTGSFIHTDRITLQTKDAADAAEQKEEDHAD